MYILSICTDKYCTIILFPNDSCGEIKIEKFNMDSCGKIFLASDVKFCFKQGNNITKYNKFAWKWAKQ